MESLQTRGTGVAGYQPMTVADLAVHLLQKTDEKTRWKTFWEFL